MISNIVRNISEWISYLIWKKFQYVKSMHCFFLLDYCFNGICYESYFVLSNIDYNYSTMDFNSIMDFNSRMDFKLVPSYFSVGWNVSNCFLLSLFFVCLFVCFCFCQDHPSKKLQQHRYYYFAALWFFLAWPILFLRWNVLKEYLAYIFLGHPSQRLALSTIAQFIITRLCLSWSFLSILSIRFKGHPSERLAVSTDANDKFFVSACRSAVVNKWDTKSHKLAWSADGEVVRNVQSELRNVLKSIVQLIIALWVIDS